MGVFSGLGKTKGALGQVDTDAWSAAGWPPLVGVRTIRGCNPAQLGHRASRADHAGLGQGSSGRSR